MLIQINSQELNIPSTLHEITIGQRIDFAMQYGDSLDADYRRIMEMPEGDDRDIAEMAFRIDKMFKELGFFMGVDPEVLQRSDFVDAAAEIYFNSLAGLIENE